MLQQRTTAVFSVLADPTRRTIIELLASRGQLAATDISNKFHISPPAISQHLKVLREANLVQVEKRAQQRIYQINYGAIDELEIWIKKLKQHWEDRFDVLDNVLAKEMKKSLKEEPPLYKVTTRRKGVK